MARSKNTAQEDDMAPRNDTAQNSTLSQRTNMSDNLNLFFTKASISVVQTFCTLFLTKVMKKHGGIFDRLGEFSKTKYLIKPQNFPFIFILQPLSIRPIVKVYDCNSPFPKADASISASFDKFIKLLDGTSDGDALFFSREIKISGNTDAVVALRNAIDGAEIDIKEEFYSLFGIFKDPIRLFTTGAIKVFYHLDHIRQEARN